MFDHQIIIILRPDSERAPYEAALSKFTRLQFCTSAVEALQFLETAPAQVAFVESDCEDMTGIEIAEAIRDIDDETGHFTYICLVGNETTESLVQGAVETIDGYMPVINETLTAAAFAGNRVAIRINAVTELNIELQRTNLQLQKGQLLDPLTGLGNRALAEQSLDSSIRQIESRGGAVCVVMIAVTNYDELFQSRDQRIADELVVAVAEKINHLVRPLDIVTYFEKGQFALILVQPSIEHCTAECYQRIYDGVRLKSYPTAAGFLPANIAMSICASHALNGPPSTTQLFDGSVQGLKEAQASDKVVVNHLTPIE
ncbi:MAG: sigma-B regulation protein RsbU (phosphoserine phosphatase) [Candidatus Azotimanducaceae bacterium]|jgi:sigma-B regulation protein RsbU (phosphoserine phosphatase)